MAAKVYFSGSARAIGNRVSSLARQTGLVMWPGSLINLDPPVSDSFTPLFSSPGSHNHKTIETP